MPDLIIDNLPVSVPAGTKVIDAAERLGIMIPRFCYHEALGSVGACRLCAVKFLAGPVKGLEMSCQVDAEDGMVVSTRDEEAVKHRRMIIELLMLNHPHDCPVCDEGGRCLLQDETVSGGHVMRRYLGRKRTHRDQYLGPLVQHEMNRCIHCWRCRRYYQEYAGYTDLGVMQLGWRTYFGRFQDGNLESPFAGNLIDLCPTGVFTDKPSRFKGRYWDYNRENSVCIHCGLGCNTVVNTRFREVVRIEPRLNRAVNGSFICDRGRYGFHYHQIPNRPRLPRIEGREATAEQALDDIVKRFGRFQGDQRNGVCCLGSPRSSLETMTALVRLCRTLGWPAPRFFSRPALASTVRHVVQRLDQRLAMSMTDLEQADFILVFGTDLLNEAPMAALAVRQAWRRGAVVAVVDPRPMDWPLDVVSLPCSAEEVPRMIRRLIHLGVAKMNDPILEPPARHFLDRLGRFDSPEKAVPEALDRLGGRLSESKRVALVCGPATLGADVVDLSADITLLMQQAGKQAGLFFILPGANGFGAGLLSHPDEAGPDLLTDIETGRIKALLVVETDLFSEFSDHRRLERVLEQLECLAVLDYLPSRTVEKADVFRPTTTILEKTDSTFINQEGRLQTATAALPGGLPLSQVNDGGHPPHAFSRDIPGDGSLPAVEVLHQIGAKISGHDADQSPPPAGPFLVEAGVLPEGLDWSLARREGVRVLASRMDGRDYQSAQPAADESRPQVPDQVRICWVDQVFGTEELSAYSPVIQSVESGPVVFLSKQDAAHWNLDSGDQVSLKFETGDLVLEARVREKTAAGILVIPRRRQWMGPDLPDTLSRTRIVKVGVTHA